MKYPDVGFLTYKNIRYPLDPNECKLTAHIGAERVTWQLEVAIAHDPNRELDVAAAWLFFGVPGVADWRELTHQRIKVDYKRPEVLLPDTPASLYFGYHVFPYRHDLAFHGREGSKFNVSWHLEAENGSKYVVDVEAKIPFTAAIVEFPEEFPKFEEGSTSTDIDRELAAWKPNLQVAQQRIGRHFAIEDFGKPKKWSWALYYPVVARD